MPEAHQAMTTAKVKLRGEVKDMYKIANPTKIINYKRIFNDFFQLTIIKNKIGPARI